MAYYLDLLGLSGKNPLRPAENRHPSRLLDGLLFRNLISLTSEIHPRTGTLDHGNLLEVPA